MVAFATVSFTNYVEVMRFDGVDWHYLGYGQLPCELRDGWQPDVEVHGSRVLVAFKSVSPLGLSVVEYNTSHNVWHFLGGEGHVWANPNDYVLKISSDGVPHILIDDDDADITVLLAYVDGTWQQLGPHLDPLLLNLDFGAVSDKHDLPSLALHSDGTPYAAFRMRNGGA